MYEIEQRLYARRKELAARLKIQFSHDNKVVSCLIAICFLLMSFAELSWRDWFSGHISLFGVILLYAVVQQRLLR